MAPALARRTRLGADLIEAAFAGLHRDVARLLQEGADVEAVDRAGYTALSEAAMAGHTVVVGQLLRALADPDSACREDGRTALHRAAFQGWLPVLKLLLEGGADPSLKDLEGKTASDLARGEKVRQLILDWPADATRQAADERRRQLELRPPPPAEEAEEEERGETAQASLDDQAGQAAGDTAPCDPPRGRDAPAAPKAFAPPPRTAAAAEESSKADREAKYREAMAKLREETGEDTADAELFVPVDEPPLIAFVRVRGAGEERLNGAYKAAFVTKERVEYQKVDDAPVQIFWTEWQNEWRMLIGDFKLGSTLYRHTYKPNTKADECHGVPKEGWQKWFGKGPEPAVELFPGGPPPEEPEEPKEESAGADAAAAGETSQPQRGKGAEFIELHSRLEIIARDQGHPTGEGLAVASEARRDVTLSLGGERLVETADGLFAPGEVPEAADGAGAAEPPVDISDVRAAAWLEDMGPVPPVPAEWKAIQAAKAAATDLYAEGKVSDARQATTAALGALRRLSDEGGEAPSWEEVEGMVGTLHSNRSLLLAQQIQANDAEALAFGAEAAWRLVATDAGEALRVDALNFKASFRRARALFELGELEPALSDATRVVDHYARNSKTPNPEAVALRDEILEAVRKERSKWGDRGRARWNRASNDDFIAEVASAPAQQVPSAPAAPFSAAASASRRAAEAQATASSVNPAPGGVVRPAAAPRNGQDVEKALLSSLKEDAARANYVKEHLSAEAIRKLFRRAPLGPDLLATMVRLVDCLAAEGGPAAAERLSALAATPSARTHAGMFDSKERGVLVALLKRLGPDKCGDWGLEEE